MVVATWAHGACSTKTTAPGWTVTITYNLVLALFVGWYRILFVGSNKGLQPGVDKGIDYESFATSRTGFTHRHRVVVCGDFRTVLEQDSVRRSAVNNENLENIGPNP